MPIFPLGQSIPPDTAHAVSVSLPTWQSNIGYEEGQEWVMSRLTTGYPRFFIHRSIDAFACDIAAAHHIPGRRAILFPNSAAAQRCLDYVVKNAPSKLVSDLDLVHLVLNSSAPASVLLQKLAPTVSAVMLPHDAFPFAKEYWQHTGDGISSRRAEFCHDLYAHHFLVAAHVAASDSLVEERPSRGPKRYQQRPPGSSPPTTASSPPTTIEAIESCRFLEERFGRNLDLTMTERARSALRRRIAGSLTGNLPCQQTASHSLDESHVYLFPAGMNAIFNTHRALLSARGPLPSISFGFPYVDSLKILQKFGPGCIFYGHSSSSDLDNLELRLRAGERYLALFCEFPGNPLLLSPDLDRIRNLADEFDFAVVVDETIGTFANVNVLPVADIVVSSLTKIFSGDSNVMGGCAILNPDSKYYDSLKTAMESGVFEDAYWPEDLVFLERNSRDFIDRIGRINTNAEAICHVLNGHPLVKDIYYPKYSSSRHHYDARRLPNGGYGGLLSIVFKHKKQAQVFYDAMESAKGPSLGTNFTLCSPYALLAHYRELPWAAQYGVDPDLVRVSVGLEDSEMLQAMFRKALAVAEAIEVT
ncbi:hypothetical protein CDD82_1292 [Ophiocordyceps australis]|uniref:cystathionine gamma-synthase n=1 Tax=Ophiocordyceps australis TaxID=1399860 RepID=A0A2C5YFU0_9HYPO|nr:hypothetical protein CDD82_1292 [Ophiocordyceps australis]